VGEVDGQPVSAALSVTLGSVTGICNVATVPAARDLGFDSVITVRALADSLAASSKWCWLENSVTESGMRRDDVRPSPEVARKYRGPGSGGMPLSVG
jgi:hypothetical protein